MNKTKSKIKSITVVLLIVLLCLLGIAVLGIISWNSLFHEDVYHWNKISEENKDYLYDLFELDILPYAEMEKAGFYYAPRDSYSLVVIDVGDDFAVEYEKYLIEQKGYTENRGYWYDLRGIMDKCILSKEEQENFVSDDVVLRIDAKYAVVSYSVNGDIKYCFMTNSVPSRKMAAAMQ